MTPFLNDEQLSAILGAKSVLHSERCLGADHDDVVVYTEEWMANAVPACWSNQDVDDLLRDLESVGLA
jgi:hypothetical protein